MNNNVVTDGSTGAVRTKVPPLERPEKIKENKEKGESAWRREKEGKERKLEQRHYLTGPVCPEKEESLKF